MSRTKIDSKQFNTLALEQIAKRIGLVLDGLKEAIEFEKDRQARIEGFYRDIGDTMKRCAEAIESLEKEK